MKHMKRNQKIKYLTKKELLKKLNQVWNLVLILERVIKKLTATERK